MAELMTSQHLGRHFVPRVKSRVLNARVILLTPWKVASVNRPHVAARGIVAHPESASCHEHPRQYGDP